jgi:hypothetical protein
MVRCFKALRSIFNVKGCLMHMRLVTAIILVVSGVLFQPVSIARAYLEEGGIPEEGKLRIDLNPFDFSMIHRGQLKGMVSLTLTLVIQDQSDSEMIRERLPQIRADFLSALTTLSRQRFDVNRPIDPDIVRAFLTPYLDHRLGANKVQVYVKHAMIKPK